MSKEFKQYIYTFEYSYVNEGVKDSTQFCAESKDEANRLFRDFCRDENLSEIFPNKVEVVYNAEDAAEYDNYGTPEDYYELQAALEELREKIDEDVDLFVIEGDISQNKNTCVLRNYYYNPNASNGNGCIEEEVLYYEDILEYLEELDTKNTGEYFGLDGKSYSYELNDANGYNFAVGFLESVDESLNGKEKTLVISINDKDHNKDLSDFLHKHFDNAAKEMDLSEKE